MAKHNKPQTDNKSYPNPKPTPQDRQPVEASAARQLLPVTVDLSKEQFTLALLNSPNLAQRINNRKLLAEKYPKSEVGMSNGRALPMLGQTKGGTVTTTQVFYIPVAATLEAYNDILEIIDVIVLPKDATKASNSLEAAIASQLADDPIIKSLQNDTPIPEEVPVLNTQDENNLVLEDDDSVSL